MGLSEQLARHALETTEIPEAARARARTRILDGLGCLAAGHRAEGSASILSLVESWGGAGESRVLGSSLKLPAHAAALASAALMRAHDFEPVEADGPENTTAAAHITGTTLPVALALAERESTSGRDFLTALVLGDDIAARLAVSSGFDVYSGQDNTGTVNGVGAAALAARLLGLDLAHTIDAFGIVVNQLAGTVEAIYDQTAAFRLPMAFAARNAIQSADLAKLGFSGPADPIEGRHGFLATYCAAPVPERIAIGLGETFHGDAVIKPWSCCRASHPSVDAATRLHQKGVRAEDVARVVVHVTPRTAGGFVGAPFRPGRSPEASAAFSIPYTTARALVDGTVRPWHMTPEAFTDPQVTGLLDRLEISPSLDPGERLTAEVEVTLTSGETLRERVDAPRGDLRTAPIGEDAVKEKFLANVAYGGAIPAARAEEAVDVVDHLDELDSITPLLDLLTP